MVSVTENNRAVFGDTRVKRWSKSPPVLVVTSVAVHPMGCKIKYTGAKGRPVQAGG